MTIPQSLSHRVATKLGHYVYLYVDPRNNKPLYVGKGQGARVLAHLKSKSTKNFPAVLKRLRAEGREPIIQILAHRLPSAQVALQVEAAVIDALGIENLANRVHGWRSRQRGLALLNELVARYTGRRVKITHKVILIRISRLFPRDLNPADLYDATRSAWKVGPRREKAKYAFAVFEGVVREVYEITAWHEAGTTFAAQHKGRRVSRPDRWEFVGVIADEKIRKRYLDSYVGDLFKQGAANPIAYRNVP